VFNGAEYLWLENPDKLTDKQQGQLKVLKEHYSKLAWTYQIKLTLQELFGQPSREAGERLLPQWDSRVAHSRLRSVIGATVMIRRRWKRVQASFESTIVIDFVEGMNSLVQAARGKVKILLPFLASGREHTRKTMTECFTRAWEVRIW